MGFGQYSPMGQERRSKRQMVEATGADPKMAKLIARNTLEYVDPADGAKVVRLHDTDVYRRTPDGVVFINTGGWNTQTTRGRINDALRGSGFAAVTHRGGFYLVDHRGAPGPWSEGRKLHEFVQRARIGPRGGVTTDANDGDAATYDSVRPLVDRYIAKLCADGIPTDTSGDPWVTPKESLGLYDESHVRLWLGDPSEAKRQGIETDEAEPYVFGTFVYHALKWSGMTDLGVSVWIRDFNEGRRSGNYVTGKVRRYIRASLGYASS